MSKITIFTLLLILIDQVSKIIVINNITSITIIKDFFNITYVNNTGAAFSILLGKKIFLIIITLIIIAIIIYYIKKNHPKNKLETIAFSLLLGGSFGNLIDRITRGYVIDFLDFKILSYNFPIFNLADTFIVAGIILLLIEEIRKDKEHAGRNKR